MTTQLQLIIIIIIIIKFPWLNQYKFLILDTWHSETLYLCEQRCKVLCLFFEAQGGQRLKNIGKHRSILLRFVSTYS
jgi:hypothetical protein